MSWSDEIRNDFAGQLYVNEDGDLRTFPEFPVCFGDFIEGSAICENCPLRERCKRAMKEGD